MVESSRTIYVDLDDVISETTVSFTAIAEKEFGKTVSYQAITSFNLQDSFQLTDIEYRRFFEVIHQPETLMGFQPVPHAVETLSKWCNKGYDIAVVTGRPAATYDISRQWLLTHTVPFSSLTMVDKYHRETHAPFASPHPPLTLDNLSRRDYVFAVEDSWNMTTFLASKMNVPVALLDRPWNQKVIEHPNINRIHGWNDMHEFLKNLML